MSPNKWGNNGPGLGWSRVTRLVNVRFHFCNVLLKINSFSLNFKIFHLHKNAFTIRGRTVAAFENAFGNIIFVHCRVGLVTTCKCKQRLKRIVVYDREWSAKQALRLNIFKKDVIWRYLDKHPSSVSGIHKFLKVFKLKRAYFRNANRLLWSRDNT